MREFMLALDAGTSRWEAAVASAASSGDMEVESACIDGGPGSIPVLGFVTDDGDVVFGREAEQRGARAPDRLIRGFTREVGDGAPVIVGGYAVTPAELVARQARWVVDDVSARRGTVPNAVVLVHPAEWSGHRIAAVQTALRTVGLDDVTMMRAAIAAVHGHPPQASESEMRTVVVYDLGGDGFRATVVQQDAERLRCVGDPVVLPDVGGDDFDDLLLAHVLRMAGADAEGAPASDRRTALADLRRAVTSAKESLSSDADAAVPMRLPSLETSVRITRSEFESMIDPMLERTLDATETAIDAAGLSPRTIDAIVLVGGSSRIPLVAQRLSERFDRPLLADDDPGATIALGAVTAAGAYLLRTADHVAEATAGEESEEADVEAEAAPRRPRTALIPALSLGAAAVLVAGGLIFTATTPAGERADADDDIGSTPPHGAVMPPRSGAYTGVVVPSDQDEKDDVSTAQDSERLDAGEPDPGQETGAPERSSGSSSTEGRTDAGAPRTGAADPAPAPQPSQPASDPAPVDAAPPGPDPEPEPEPTTDPTPVPEPTTDPAPAPEPTGEPAPTTDPPPAPAPEPTSDPAPAPEPESTSAPAPSPEPTAAETPAP